MAWEIVKDHLKQGYRRVAQFLLFEGLVLYLLACIAARHLLGPDAYAAFLLRLFTFRG